MELETYPIKLTGFKMTFDIKDNRSITIMGNTKSSLEQIEDVYAALKEVWESLNYEGKIQLAVMLEKAVPWIQNTDVLEKLYEVLYQWERQTMDETIPPMPLRLIPGGKK